MVERARSNIFSVFMRKIGYSVGLEHTLDRIKDFATRYAAKDTLSHADISRLLHEEKPRGWGLDQNNEHILDVLRALGIIDVRRGEVAVLELGDSLGILRKMLESDEDFSVCARLLFAHAIIQADGDIFLNALASAFDANEFCQRSTCLLEHKWSLLERYYTTSQQRVSIYSAVNIESQTNNPGSRGRNSFGSNLDPMRLRAVRGALIANVSRPEPQISEAYLTKALPRRKAWAISLGLAEEDGTPTPHGIRLLESLARAGYAGPNCMATWPLEHELRNAAFAALKSADFPVLSSWQFIALVGRGLGLVPPKYSELQNEEVISTLAEIISIYKSLNKSKIIVRSELPVRIAYRCFAGLGSIRGSLPDVPKAIEDEQKSASPRIVARPSILAEMALSK